MECNQHGNYEVRSIVDGKLYTVSPRIYKRYKHLYEQEEAEQQEPEVVQEYKSLDEMTKNELEEWARQFDVELDRRNKKETLLEICKELEQENITG